MSAVLLVAWTRRLSLRADPLPRPAVRRWLVGLRAAALCLLIAALAGPSLLRAWRQARPAEVAVVIDDSASMAIADGPGGRTRWARALSLAALADSVVRAREPSARAVLWRGSAGPDLQPLRPDDGRPPAAVGTDLKGLVRAVAAEAAGGPLRGIVLLTDGHDTATEADPPLPAATDASLLAVGVGDPVGPPDLAVQDLRYPETAFVGDEAIVEVTVARRGAGAEPAAVVARLRAGGRAVAEASAPAPPGEGVVTLELAVRPVAPGLQAWDLDVVPLDNERYLENNRATLAVDVRPGRQRLLLLSGRTGWDARFLAQAALADGRQQLSIVRPGPSGPVLADSGRAWTPPADAAGWRAWDGVIVAGWAGQERAVDWTSLATAVRDGLGLLVLATEGAPGADRIAPPPAALADLLPVAVEGVAWRPGDWLLREAPGAEGHSLLRGVTRDVGSAPPLDSGRWPPLRQLLPARARPGAQVLLVATTPGTGAQTAAPVLVTGRAEQGRVTWFGGRRLWELAFWEQPLSTPDPDAHPGRRLLRNLLTWTATGEGKPGLRLTGQRRTFAEGERVRLEAQWRDARGVPAAPGRPLAVELSGPRGAAAAPRTFALSPVPGDSSRASVVLPPIEAGIWSARPIAGGDPPAEGPALEFLVTRQAVEAAQTRQDRRNLRAMAAQSGGRYVAGDAPEAAARLADAMSGWSLAAEERPARRRQEPLTGWPLLLAALALLGCEWALRRAQGLP